MRQVVNGKRSRGRSNRKSGSPRNPTYDSSGPEGKVRGTANQVFEKYLALARDAHASGDRIAAENFYQHAEHYFRIMNANAQAHADRSRQMVNGAMPGMQTEAAGADPGGFPIPPAADDPAPEAPATQANGEAEGADGEGEARPSRRRRAQRRAAAEQEEANAGQQGA